MSAEPITLLKLLGSRALPGLAPVTAPSAGSRTAGVDFARLLQQAREGQLPSGREVTIGRGAGVSLSDEQIQRISAAADLAESQGATRALVMIDGLAIKLDVSMREITGAVDMKKLGIMTGIDAVVEVPPSSAVSQEPGTRGTVHSAALLKTLAGRAQPRVA